MTPFGALAACTAMSKSFSALLLFLLLIVITRPYVPPRAAWGDMERPGGPQSPIEEHPMSRSPPRTRPKSGSDYYEDVDPRFAEPEPPPAVSSSHAAATRYPLLSFRDLLVRFHHRTSLMRISPMGVAHPLLAKQATSPPYRNGP